METSKKRVLATMFSVAIASAWLAGAPPAGAQTAGSYVTVSGNATKALAGTSSPATQATQVCSSNCQGNNSSRNTNPKK